jgi:hypothetical protein
LRAAAERVIVMRLFLLVRNVITLSLFCFIGCGAIRAPLSTKLSDPAPSKSNTPFKLSIVPTTSSSDSRVITMAVQKPDEFYVVLTNVSSEPQSVWEYSNSWGYQTISFEFTLDKKQRIVVSKGPQDFTRNFPSTFTIPPGEHKVYAVRLNREWNTGSIPKSNEMPIGLKVIYDVPKTPEASQYNVWIGHIESPDYELMLRQW